MSIRVSRYNEVSNRYSKGSATYDRFAGAFIDAAELRGRVEQGAIFNLVRDLNRSGLWSKMKAVYPFIGGTASSHKWNLIDPQDTNAAFRLTFSGGWTHGSTGATPNGTNAYADTFMSANPTLAENSHHMSYYSRTTGVGSDVKQDMGQTKDTGRGDNYDCILITTRQSGSFIAVSTSLGQLRSVTNADSHGFYSLSRTSNVIMRAFKNGVKQGADVTTTDTGYASLTGTTIFLGATSGDWDVSGVNVYGNRECALATIGDGLTDSEASLLFNCVDRYQKFLGRAV